MRQILVNHVKRRQTAKRSGGNRVTLIEAAGLTQEQGADLIALDGVLERLAVLDSRQSWIVELRFFGGLTEEEIAEVVGVSPFTVRREWRIAKAVLCEELRSPFLDVGPM